MKDSGISARDAISYSYGEKRKILFIGKKSGSKNG
jgi:hypothetical protein